MSEGSQPQPGQPQGSPNPQAAPPGQYPPAQPYQQGQQQWGQPQAPGQQAYGKPGYPQQAYGQPNTGQQPGYPQPAYGQPNTAPQPAYGQPNTPPQQGYGQPYAQPQYPQQPGYQQQYPQPQYPASGYSQATYPAAGKPVAKSPILGLIGFALVALALVGGLVAIQPVVAVISQVIAQTGSPQIDEEYLTQLLTEQAAGASIMLNVASALGFAGFVTGIVATAMNRGRKWGVFAIILGVLAPIIMIGVLVAQLLPYLPAA